RTGFAVHLAEYADQPLLIVGEGERPGHPAVDVRREPGLPAGLQVPLVPAAGPAAELRAVGAEAQLGHVLGRLGRRRLDPPAGLQVPLRDEPAPAADGETVTVRPEGDGLAGVGDERP